MKNRKFWTADKIISLAAIFISFLTLYIFIRQTNIIERQSRLSVIPYLFVETSENSGNNTYSLDLVNHGVGPAFIDHTVIVYKGERYEQQFADFLIEQKRMDSIEILNQTSIIKGHAIRSGDAINVFTVGGDTKSFDEFLRIVEDLTEGEIGYEVQYRSIYGDRWKIHAAWDATDQVPEALDD